jgi:2-keto-4-pentenoate hydratase
MTQNTAVQSVAAALLAARRGGPLADSQALATALREASEAYLVQDLVLAELGDDVSRPVAWKSGGASREVTLTHAPLPRAGVLPSGADVSTLPLNLRLVEAEVALRLARDVTPQQAQALSAEPQADLVDAMCVSIELVDSRWSQGPQAPALLKLADFQVHGALVLGAFVPWQARDWSRQECVVQIGGKTQRFTGTHSMADPAWLLPTWLRHATRNGHIVPKGTVVTTGTWCGLLPAQKGDRVSVAFPGIGEASVQL